MATPASPRGAELQRLIGASDEPWRKWGPYLSERQWGTVREDYSESGDAWNFFTRDQARSRAYRWGEDGLAGICDERQLLCFALALWNGKDAILKERLFGLTNSEGNHGEDVKEYYFYLDSTPTHSYMKYLYKYPQGAFPYEALIKTNGERGRHGFEYELLETGIFDQDRYFDVFVEYAKAAPEDILIRMTVHNRGPEDATLHLLPTLWFRNVWSWDQNSTRPSMRQIGAGSIAAVHPELGERLFHAEGAPEWLFTENETNFERFHAGPNRTPYVKDGFNNRVLYGQAAVNPDKTGTKASAYYRLTVPAGGSQVVRLRLSDMASTSDREAAIRAADFDRIIKDRLHEADEFYAGVIPSSCDADRQNVMRQALAGMLWSKQFYNYDVDRWLSERGSDPFRPTRRAPRNDRWHHMANSDIISMPDKWEYPWCAAWDLAFHVLALTPLCAVTVFEGEVLNKYPELSVRFRRFLQSKPELRAFIHDPAKAGENGRRLASILNEQNLRRVLSTMLDEREFLSPYGIRSLSRFHEHHPYVFRVGDQDYGVSYLPAESDSGMFGGNSNWRGPIWMPVNGLIIRALLQYYTYYGDSFTIECPTGSGRRMTLYQVAEDIGRRLTSMFLKDDRGRRPVYGGTRKFQDDPHWRDLLLFYEYFHGDNGAGLGASHQTGWTGIVARIMQLFGTTTAEQVRELGKAAAFSSERPTVAG